MGESSDLQQEVLKPLYRRASEAEERLSRLEAAIYSNKDAGNVELSKVQNELQFNLESKNAELLSEKVKEIQKLTSENQVLNKEKEKLATENAKQQYRIIHLLRALKEAQEEEEK